MLRRLLRLGHLLQFIDCSLGNILGAQQHERNAISRSTARSTEQNIVEFGRLGSRSCEAQLGKPVAQAERSSAGQVVLIRISSGGIHYLIQNMRLQVFEGFNSCHSTKDCVSDAGDRFVVKLFLVLRDGLISG